MEVVLTLFLTWVIDNYTEDGVDYISLETGETYAPHELVQLYIKQKMLN